MTAECVLNYQNVEAVMKDCLYGDSENITDSLKVQGVVNNYAFNPVKLAHNRAKIAALLDGLPENFKKEVGGGWSFLQAVENRDGEHWAEHQTVGWLLVLGIATKQAAYILPDRNMWKIFPGNLPYFYTELEAADVEEGYVRFSLNV